MKQTIITISLLLLTLIPAGAVKKIQANPINVAIQLVEKTDSAKVASTLEYYGYKPQGTEDGYQVLKDVNGNEIKYTFNTNGSKSKYPTIIVKVSDIHKAIDSRLRELNFVKKGDSYERMKNQYSTYKIQCGIGHQNTLIIRRILN